MNDIDLYQKETNSYESIQNKRPDYRGAREMFATVVAKLFGSCVDVNVVDFCCGTGNNSVLVS